MVAAELSTDMTRQLVMGQKGHEHRAEQSGGGTEQGWGRAELGQSRAAGADDEVVQSSLRQGEIRLVYGRRLGIIIL
jgi:hypothetical protein